METTIPAAFAAAVRRDPTTPLLTWYDDATGDRTELSGATLDNWVAKTANMLVDGVGLGAGDGPAVLLPPHWQTAAVLLGCWAAGLAVDTAPSRSRSRCCSPPPDAVDAGGRLAGRRPVRAGLLPLAMPLREVPPGWHRLHGRGPRLRRPLPASHRGADDRALAGPVELSHRAVLREATSAPSSWASGRRPGAGRRRAPTRTRVDWLLAPLVAGAAIVLCGNLDPAKLTGRSPAEQVTAVTVS